MRRLIYNLNDVLLIYLPDSLVELETGQIIAPVPAPFGSIQP
jgi:hypothetical protein